MAVLDDMEALNPDHIPAVAHCGQTPQDAHVSVLWDKHYALERRRWEHGLGRVLYVAEGRDTPAAGTVDELVPRPVSFGSVVLFYDCRDDKNLPKRTMSRRTVKSVNVCVLS